MQHVYGHTGNLGNECADNATAPGTFGLVSNHNLSTRFVITLIRLLGFVLATTLGRFRVEFDVLVRLELLVLR